MAPTAAARRLLLVCALAAAAVRTTFAAPRRPATYNSQPNYAYAAPMVSSSASTSALCEQPPLSMAVSGDAAAGESGVSSRPALSPRAAQQAAAHAKLREITERLAREPPKSAWVAAAPRRSPVVAAAEGAARAPLGGSSGGAAVLERAAPKTDLDRATRRDTQTPDLHKVVIYNDEDNTRAFVSRCLVQCVGLAESEAYDIMTTAHNTGLAIVGVWPLERAEAYADLLRLRGLTAVTFPVDNSSDQ